MNTMDSKKEKKQSIPLKGLWKLHSQVYKNKTTRTTGCVISYIVGKVQPKHKCTEKNRKELPLWGETSLGRNKTS